MYACQLNVSGYESTVVWPSQPDATFTCPPVERTLQVSVDARGFGTALRGGCGCVESWIYAAGARTQRARCGSAQSGGCGSDVDLGR
jgi:hypothetical protein